MFSYKAVWPTDALDKGQSNRWLSMRRNVWAMQRDLRPEGTAVMRQEPLCLAVH